MTVPMQEILEVYGFLNSPKGQAFMEKLLPGEPAMTKAERAKMLKNEAKIWKQEHAYTTVPKMNTTVKTLQNVMGLNPKTIAIKAAANALGEVPGVFGDWAVNNAVHDAQNSLMGDQTDVQRQAHGISPMDKARQIYGGNRMRKAANLKRGLDAIGNVVKNTVGMANQADMMARHLGAMSVTGQHPSGYFYQWMNQRMKAGGF